MVHIPTAKWGVDMKFAVFAAGLCALAILAAAAGLLAGFSTGQVVVFVLAVVVVLQIAYVIAIAIWAGLRSTRTGDGQTAKPDRRLQPFREDGR